MTDLAITFSRTLFMVDVILLSASAARTEEEQQDIMTMMHTDRRINGRDDGDIDGP